MTSTPLRKLFVYPRLASHCHLSWVQLHVSATGGDVELCWKYPEVETQHNTPSQARPELPQDTEGKSTASPPLYLSYLLTHASNCSFLFFISLPLPPTSSIFPFLHPFRLSHSSCSICLLPFCHPLPGSPPVSWKGPLANQGFSFCSSLLHVSIISERAASQRL